MKQFAVLAALGAPAVEAVRPIVINPGDKKAPAIQPEAPKPESVSSRRNRLMRALAGESSSATRTQSPSGPRSPTLAALKKRASAVGVHGLAGLNG